MQVTSFGYHPKNNVSLDFFLGTSTLTVYTVHAQVKIDDPRNIVEFVEFGKAIHVKMKYCI